MDTTELRVETGDRLVTDLTPRLRAFCDGRGDGLVNAFLPHATAGLALIETGSGSEADLDEAVERLLPVGAGYRHLHGSRHHAARHGRDHVLPAFVAPSLSVPVAGGQPLLGVWQSLVLVDSNIDNPIRTVRLSFLAG